jgi:hypothetical protein
MQTFYKHIDTTQPCMDEWFRLYHDLDGYFSNTLPSMDSSAVFRASR